MSGEPLSWTETFVEPQTSTGTNKSDYFLPASGLQNRLWTWFEQDSYTAGAHIVGRTDVYENPLDTTVFRRALTDVAARHEILRTSFVRRGERLLQRVESDPRIVISTTEVTAEELMARLAHDVRVGFDLERAPLFRVHVFDLDATEHVVAYIMHAAVGDRRSLEIFAHEVSQTYSSLLSGGRPDLRPVSVQYGDFASWQRQYFGGPVARELRAYWNEQLVGLEVLDLAVRRQDLRSRNNDRFRIRDALSSEVMNQLRLLGRALGATPFMTLLAAFSCLLARLTGQTDVAVGAQVSGRVRPELESTIGPLADLLVFRCDLRDGPSFGEAVRHVRDTALAAYMNQDLPYGAWAEQSTTAGTRQSQVRAVLAVSDTDDLLDEPPFVPMSGLVPAPDLALHIAHADGEASVVLDARTDLFETAEAERVLQRFGMLLESMVSRPEQSIADATLMTDDDRALLEVLRPPVSAPSVDCVHDLVTTQVIANPDADALVCGSERLSYRELDERANRLAHYLRARGIGREDRVGVYCERSADAVVAMLGVLKAGGAYLPLDPGYPASWIAFVLGDARPKAVVTQPHLADRLDAPDALRVLLADTTGQPTTTPPALATSASLAYVLYTSGSTGRPKGVAIEHRNTVAMCRWAANTFDRRELARVYASTSICFDLSVFEIFAPLTTGGAVLLAEGNALDLLKDRHLEPTLVNTVPYALAELVRAGGIPDSVRTVNAAGEPLPEALVAQMFETTRAERVHNLYGPTECTTYSTDALLLPGCTGTPLIGLPIDGTRAHVLDERMRPVLPGARGELYLGGVGVARGYLNRPELTEDRFVPDPFGDPGARLYRTGDLVRLCGDAGLEYLGRTDFQVKVHGYRIEPGEVEAALRRHPDVAAAAVVPRGDGATRHLHAYLVGDPARPTPSDLRAYLTERLPSYLVPTGYSWLPRLPLTPSGKVDRAALPQPADNATRSPYVSPSNPLEWQLAALFEELLELDRVGADDDFFALGGHSMLATRLTAAIRDRLGVLVPLQHLFVGATVANLAAFVARHRERTRTADVVLRDELRTLVDGLSANEVDELLGGRGVGLNEEGDR